MKSSEIKNNTLNELNKMKQKLSSDLLQLKFKHGLGQLEKTAKLKKLRKEIARVKTFMREKEVRDEK